MIFFAKHEKVFRPFVSPSYMDTAKKTLQKTKKEPTKATILETQPEGINGEMRGYQLDGLNWLIKLYDKGLCGILGDEMGLGKTLQTVSMIHYLKTVRNRPGPFLIVCPLNVLANWCNEFSRWAPNLIVVRFHGPKRVLYIFMLVKMAKFCDF